MTTRPPQTSATGQGHATGVTAGKAAASTPKELEARLLVELPEEFDQDNDGDGTGPMDVADAAANESDQSTGEVRLRAEGFVRGHDRSWTDVVSNKDRYITLTLLQFGDQAGAEAEAAHTRDVIAGEGALDTHFDVPEIPGSFGAGGSDVKDGYAVVLFVRGPYMVLIDFEDQGSAATAMKGVVPLAESQFGRL